MGRRCVVPRCKSGYDSCPEKVSMFSIPKNRLEDWQKAIARTDRALTLRDAVCEKHFLKKDVIRVVKTPAYTYNLERPKLSENAIPRIFPICPKYQFRPRASKLLSSQKLTPSRGSFLPLMNVNIQFMEKQVLTAKEKQELPPRNLFMRKLRESRKQIGYSKTFSKQMYSKLIEQVFYQTPKSSNTLKKYDIVEINGEKKLTSYRSGRNNMQIYIHDDELFDILQNAHVSLKHGGQYKMMIELKKNFKNICFKDVILYITLCPRCSKKKVKVKKKRVTKKEEPIDYHTELSASCQLNIIDYQSSPDCEFKFVLTYQNCMTKFFVLKPLRSQSPNEIFSNISDIFAFIGIPAFIHSNVESNLIKDVIKKLKKLWPTLQITHVKCNEDESNESCNNVKEHLENWMEHNNTEKWSEGLRFVQLAINNDYNPDINQAPYDLLFKLRTDDEEGNEEIVVKYKTDMEESDDQTNDTSGNIIKEENIEIFSYVCEVCGNDTEDELSCLICQNNY